MNGPLIAYDDETVILALVSDERVEPQLKSGELMRVLEDRCSRSPVSSFITRAEGSSLQRSPL